MVQALFYLNLILIPFGLTVRVLDFTGGAFIMSVGLFGISIYYLAKSLKDVIQRNLNWSNIGIRVVLILMSITIFSRYMQHSLWDYPGIITLPLFIFVLIIHFLKKKKDLKITSTSILFIALILPLFGSNFIEDTRALIPKEWYNNDDMEREVKISLPWTYELRLAKNLSDSAFQLEKSNNLERSIKLYEESLSIEYNPQTLFKISTALASVNSLEKAIFYLDTLIAIDPSFAGSYGNRGLIYYRMKKDINAILDLKKAIELDPNQPSFHSNLALAYYQINRYDDSCKEIEIATNLGSDLLETRFFMLIVKKMNCQNQGATTQH